MYLIRMTFDIKVNGQLVFDAFFYSLLQFRNLLTPETVTVGQATKTYHLLSVTGLVYSLLNKQNSA